MTKINPKIDYLRISVGIARTADGPTLVVIKKDGTVEDPLVGLQKFAELIVNECINVLHEAADDVDNGDIFSNQDLLSVFKERFSAGLYYGADKIRETLLEIEK